MASPYTRYSLTSPDASDSSGSWMRRRSGARQVADEPLPDVLDLLPDTETRLDLALAVVKRRYRPRGLPNQHSDEPEVVLQTANRSGRWSDELEADSAGNTAHHVPGRAAH